MKRVEHGRFMLLVIPTSWSILPLLHVGKVAGVSHGRKVTLTVGWLCAHASLKLG